jgi:RimJ/RimL family protein N-acetyltransferase
MNELKTERLLLRQWEQRDFEFYAEYYADEEAARYVGGHCDRDKAWRRMAMLIGHWALRGYGLWAVEEKETGSFVGCVGLWFSDGWPELELGYWLRREMQGKGYALEAARASRDYAFEVVGADTLVSYVHRTTNLPSGLPRSWERASKRSSSCSTTVRTVSIATPESFWLPSLSCASLLGWIQSPSFTS